MSAQAWVHWSLDQFVELARRAHELAIAHAQSVDAEMDLHGVQPETGGAWLLLEMLEYELLAGAHLAGIAPDQADKPARLRRLRVDAGLEAIEAPEAVCGPRGASAAAEVAADHLALAARGVSVFEWRAAE